MKFIAFSILIGTFGLVACKTSNFKGGAAAVENPPEEPQITTTTPTVTTGTETPNIPPVDTTSVDTSTTELQLNQSCEKPVQLLKSQVKLNFPERKKCRFNVEPNKEPRDAFLQAHEVSTSSLKLPEDSEICSMTLEAPANAKIQYDDFLILTIDDFVIFSSNKDFVPKLDQVNGLYKWDFLKVRGEPVDFDALPYCIGAMDRCAFPKTDTVGPISFKLNYNEIVGIAKAIKGKAEVPVDLVATGDNDDSNEKMDCFHTALEITATLNYIKKPK
ncbi:hypothetical protein [Oligoflexus tunisiensis]|uniref:hypothetical protein n=1 Tax=Oligoflexus tunisiensis TaxID=708132 RepID=UPI00114C96F1|nr:hypothetical protein [Oligoflexus tunisiensis]